MKIVIDAGGSVLCSGSAPNTSFIRKFSKLLLELRKKHQVIVVVGGGALAKNYIGAARELKIPESQLDLIGIDATRMNARVLISVMGEHAYQKPVRDFGELANALLWDKVIVLGGLTPGQTTDAVSVQVAEFIGADMLIVGTDVPGIYDKNPKEHRDAKPLKRMSAQALFQMVQDSEFAAGKSSIIDPVAAKLLTRSKIKTVVLGIKDLENLKKAASGKPFKGTLIA